MAIISKNQETVERIIRGEATAAEAVAFVEAQEPSVAPKWGELKRQWYPEFHKSGRKAAKLAAKHKDRHVPTIGIADQQRYARRAVDLMFSRAVTREWRTQNESGDSEDKTKAEIAKTIESVLTSNAYDALNRDRFEAYFGACQMATVWQSYQKLDRFGAVVKQRYGDKESDYKITPRVYNPIEGDKIHPVYDVNGDLVLLGIGTSSTVYGEEEKFFIIMSSTGVQTFQNVGGSWVNTDDSDELPGSDIGKIPAAFIERKQPIWGGTSPITDERENRIIDNSLLIDYNSVPDRTVSIDPNSDTAAEDIENLMIQLGVKERLPSGEVVNVPPEKRREGTNLSRNYIGKGISVDISTWPGSTEALKYHLEQLLNIQEDDIGLPDLTPNAISNISTDTLQLILEVSALRVVSESGRIEKFMRREITVIKELIKPMFVESEWKVIDELEFVITINPFQITNRLQEAQITQIENGNKPTISWKSSVKRRVGAEQFGGEWDQLQEENVTETLNDQGAFL